MAKKKKVELKQFFQVPIFSEEETFEITSKELTELFKISELYSKFVPLFEQFVARQIDKGKISIKYIDEKGNELSKEEVTDIINLALKKTKENFTENIEPDL